MGISPYGTIGLVRGLEIDLIEADGWRCRRGSNGKLSQWRRVVDRKDYMQRMMNEENHRKHDVEGVAVGHPV